MSDQSGIEAGEPQGGGLPADFDDDYGDVDPEVVELREQVSALQQGHLEERLAGFVEQFPRYAEKETATAFVEEVNRRAQALNAPHASQSVDFYHQVAADIEREERIASERYERSDEARIDRIFRPGASSRVLPFG